MDKETLMWTEKYRPKTFADMINKNDVVISTLRNFIESDSMPHLLFYGKSGTGKTSTIMACMRELYKDELPYMVMELNASDSRGIDVIRRLVKQFACYNSVIIPKNKKYKFIILDEIDAQTKDAQCLLKRIIETYSSNTRFCLICNDKNKIDMALQSRCTKFRFRPHSPQVINSYLKNICKNEKIKYEEGALNIIIENSYGDMRKSINSLQSVYMSFKEINVENVYNYLGICNEEEITKIYNMLMDKKDFSDTYVYISGLIRSKNIPFGNILTEIFDKVVNDSTAIGKKYVILNKLAEIQYEMCMINTYEIFLASFISAFYLDKKDYEPINLI